ncbi:response regulator transcription factor [Pedobacter sp. GR22-10]|nr:response regulator transcription factor [Pedobacter sp. GR22-10]
MGKKLPDVLLLDIQMPGMQGDELAQAITAKYPGVAILALTNMDMPFHVRNMFASGVKGYLLKSATKNILVSAIETVSRGQQYIDISLKEQLAFELVEGRRSGMVPVLTQREKKILEMIAEEKTNPQIAGELFISLSTVENHRTNLFFKLGVKNAAGLVRKGIQMGLIR